MSPSDTAARSPADPRDQKRLEKYRKQAQKAQVKADRAAAKAHRQAHKAQTAAERVRTSGDKEERRVEKETGGPTPVAAPADPPARKNAGRLARLRRKAAKSR